jgi:hypothetical protein
MRAINRPIVFYGKEFQFNRFLGCLICEKDESRDDFNNELPDSISDEKRRDIEAVHNPFMMLYHKKSNGWKEIKQAWIAKMYGRLITWLCLHCYPVMNVFIHFHLNLFSNAGYASLFYYNLYPDLKSQQILCLPRSIFIATTSRRFKQYGVLFIGAFLPTVRMHAWIIEDGMPADCFDKQWIHYNPVMMFL